MTTKHNTIYPGVRFREHLSRKYNGSADRYFFIRYRLNGKLKEEGLGWASEGWNAKKASNSRWGSILRFIFFTHMVISTMRCNFTQGNLDE